MPQYWIQTPVENAKEVVQRYLDANSGTLTGYAGATISYDEQCEVVLYNSDLVNFTYDFNTIYFGNVIVESNVGNGYLDLYDGNNQIYIFDLAYLSAIPSPGIYKSILWNNNGVGFGSSGLYFIGYKFNITTP